LEWLAKLGDGGGAVGMLQRLMDAKFMHELHSLLMHIPAY
jgi:hypothetical protein